MLYKYLFSILCGHLNLNKKIEFGRLPVSRRLLNSNLNLTGSDRFPAKPDRYTEPDSAGLAGPVGKLNPGHSTRTESWQLAVARNIARRVVSFRESIMRCRFII